MKRQSLVKWTFLCLLLGHVVVLAVGFPSLVRIHDERQWVEHLLLNDKFGMPETDRVEYEHRVQRVLNYIRVKVKGFSRCYDMVALLALISGAGLFMSSDLTKPKGK
jgi:hypothetical protein